VIKKAIKSVGRLLGVEITRVKAESPENPPTQPRYTHPVELDAEDRSVLEFVLENQLSMCGYNNLVTTLLACKHVVEQGIQGALWSVESGVAVTQFWQRVFLRGLISQEKFICLIPSPE
jgi:hypothetical protein